MKRQTSLSFAATLGGNLTLVGSSPNLAGMEKMNERDHDRCKVITAAQYGYDYKAKKNELRAKLANMKPQTRPNDNLRGHGANKKTAVFLRKKGF